MKIPVTLSIVHDAYDPWTRDTTVDISSFVIEALKSRFTDVEIQSQLADRFVVTANVDIEDVSAFHVGD